MGIKNMIRRVAPRPIWHALRAVRTADETGTNAEIFSRIYQQNKWGGEPGQFYSGSGSDDEASETFVEAARAIIASHEVKTVLDLGCGDFRVGGRIACKGVQYIGVDVVPALVARNNQEFGSADVRFECLDAVIDPLPTADLILIRQVLQHLSNAQIATILAKLSAFPIALIAEHHPAPELLREMNLDKRPGSDVRVYRRSGVYLEAPPFSLKNARVIAESPTRPLDAAGERISLYLVMRAQARH